MTRSDFWTEPRDATLRRLRLDGVTWAEIAAALGVTPDVARERGRRIGARRGAPDTAPPREDPDRPPLPPGHPRSWGLLIEGTVLDGTAWPGW
jgi:hypothetical protein